MPDPRKPPPIRKPERETPKSAKDDVLKPGEPPGDVPSIGEEFTVSGTDKSYWLHPSEEEPTEFLL
ncbi:MAG TPA: hypothetical protein V6C52_08355 [Coleofasciculaceae cyanobacterium]|jgi:hypothetical protein